MHEPNTDLNTLDTTTCHQCNHKFVAPIPIEPLSPQTLHSDCIPSEAEISQYKPVVEVQEAILRLYDEEIARLQGILDKLMKERDMVQDRIRERCSAASSVRRTPNEIWIEIFQYCVDDEFSFSANCERVSKPGLDISQVCSRWRRIACCTPTLWTSFLIDLYDVKQDLCSVIVLYLKRSGALPLRVCLTDHLEKCPPWGGGMSTFKYELKLEERVGRNGPAAAQVIVEVMDRIGELDIDIKPDVLDLLIGKRKRWDEDSFSVRDPWFS
ncbi:hypothetical protein V5O48_011175 [Marasmius crinis-equi]|uniref:F-box domain-containing protein n=1 Tax=Marasmius crinis-equi TaxID=585013 RepID=A0ABR3F6B0_9AGAR